MYCVRNRTTGKLTTATTDRYRAERVAAGFEQLRIVPDIGATNYYWYLPVLRFNQPHPYDVAAAEDLQAEFTALAAAHRAGCNA